MKICQKVKIFSGVVLILCLISASLIYAVSQEVASKESAIYVPILTYHRILQKTYSTYDLTADQLEEELRYIKQHNYHPITAAQFFAWRDQPRDYPPNPIVLSFDDGPVSQFTRALPLLQKYGFKATFFIYPIVIKDQVTLAMNWEEINKLIRAGMDVQCHTMTHPYLTQGPNESDQAYQQRLVYELKDAKVLLEKKLNKPIDFLAYPFGWFNSKVEAEAIKAGFKGVFTVNWGSNRLDENPLRFKRRIMTNNVTINHFQQIIAYRPLNLQILSPEDIAIINAKQPIRFKIIGQDLTSVSVTIGTKRVVVTPDQNGVYTFNQFNLGRRGFYMVIIKGVDAGNNQYLGSWGFDYEYAI